MRCNYCVIIVIIGCAHCIEMYVIRGGAGRIEEMYVIENDFFCEK